MIALIAALDINFGIGNKGTIPWNYKTDMNYFKAVTQGSRIVMGRKTWESIGKPLSGRDNCVVSKTAFYEWDRIPKVYVYKDLQDAMQLTRGNTFLIGGSEIYREGIESGLVEYMFLTYVPGVYDCDTHFPEFTGEWKQEYSLVDQPTGLTFACLKRV